MSLRIVPGPKHVSSTSNTTSKGAPSAPGVHDALRAGLGDPSSTPSAATTTSRHPLENRLRAWDETQENVKMEMLRRMFGLQEPVRRQMEIELCSKDFRPQLLGGPSNVHLDILRNKDTTITWDDVFNSEELKPLPEFHAELETRCKMNW